MSITPLRQVRASARAQHGRLAAITLTVATAAATAALLAAPQLAHATASAPSTAARHSASPSVRIAFIYGEAPAPAGSTSWEWLAPGEQPGHAYMPFNHITRAIITGSAVFGSSNGQPVRGMLGVCYQQEGTGPIHFGNWAPINFTAPAGTWVTQAVSGTILPGYNNLPSGTYELGLCVSQTSANLVYESGASTGDVIVAENAGGQLAAP
jgi:hypothetical protein